jgi:hypothetical protein
LAIRMTKNSFSEAGAIKNIDPSLSVSFLSDS